MKKAFPCKTQGCREEVVYEPIIVIGLAGDAEPDDETDYVYLTCARGHVHTYPVPEQA